MTRRDEMDWVDRTLALSVAGMFVAGLVAVWTGFAERHKQMFEPVTQTETYEAEVWCARRAKGFPRSSQRCQDEMAGPFNMKRRTRSAGVLEEIMVDNAGWATLDPQRKAKYWAGRAAALADDAREAKQRAVEAQSRVDVAMTYTDNHGCEHRIGSDGRERDQFKAFVSCSKKRLGLA